MKNRTKTVEFAIFILFLGLIVSCSSVPKENQDKTEGKKPYNVLFIFADDLNASVEGFGGQPQTLTPNIDKLASEGVRFTNAHSNNPLCIPSRASIWNGLHPHTSGFYIRNPKSGIKQWRDNPVFKNNVTVFKHFYNNGYQVLGTGKIFHGNRSTEELFKLQDGTPAFGAPLHYGPFPWNGKSHPAATPHPDMPAPWGEGRFAGFESLVPLSNVPHVRPNRGKGIPGHEGWVVGGEPFHYESEEDRDLMPDERSTNWAVNQLKKDFDKPFFMTVGIVRPHTPFVVPKKYYDKFPWQEMEFPPYKENDLEDVGSYVKKMKKVDKWFTRFERLQEAYPDNEGWKRFVQGYLASVNFVDDQVGKILEALSSSSNAENTIVVFSSDHGLHMGQKDMLIKKTPWEESTHVPLIINAPNMKAGGQRSDHPVSLVDIYPTLIDLTGLPGDPNKNGNEIPLDGYSLRPFLENTNEADWPGPDFVISSIEGGIAPPSNSIAPVDEQHFTLRSKEWRYVLYNNGEEELYDLEEDPNEWDNLAYDNEYQEVRQELKEKLFDATGRDE